MGVFTRNLKKDEAGRYLIQRHPPATSTAVQRVLTPAVMYSNAIRTCYPTVRPSVGAPGWMWQGGIIYSYGLKDIISLRSAAATTAFFSTWHLCVFLYIDVAVFGYNI